MRSFLPCCCLLLFTGGCLFQNVNVAPPDASALVQPSNLGRGREIILETPFVDKRFSYRWLIEQYRTQYRTQYITEYRTTVIAEAPSADDRLEPVSCGTRKNGYDRPMGPVICTVPPPVWLSNALGQGLTSAGFRVHGKSEGVSPSAVHIQGTVLEFFVEPAASNGLWSKLPEADMSVRLVVTTAAGLRAERVFYVKGTEASFTGTDDDNFQLATNHATRQIVSAMVSAIAQLLDRYPSVGEPNAVDSAKASSL